MNDKAKLDILFQPLVMHNLTLKNRFFMAPMATAFKMNQLKHYLEARAKGGVGLITTAEVSVHRSGRAGINHEPRLEKDEDINILAPIVKAVQNAGAKIVAQLNHVGRYAHSKKLGQPSVAPSAIPSKYTGETPMELSTGEVEDLVAAFAQAAFRAQQSGFDGIEFCGCSGYLISQFLSQLTNKREDKYGGDLLKRTRFLTDILKEARSLTGPDFNICVKFDADDGMKGGKTLDESKIMAPLFVEAGADRLHVWAGWHEASRPMLPMFVPPGAFSCLAKEIKKTVNVPVATVGRINDPYIAAEILLKEDADLIGLGRPLLCDPEFVCKTQSGRVKEIRKCIACCYCFDKMMSGMRGNDPTGVACALNPELGFEGEGLLARPPGKKKHVLVVGAGPAGMEAARAAALRGHAVSLYEKMRMLGGMLNLACLPPHKEELKTIVPYYESQLKKLGVKINMDHEMTGATIKAISPDAVVLAMGSFPLIPDLPGIKKKHVVTALQVLSGLTFPGQHVVVVGGGLVGMEIGEFLADQGKTVTVVEMLDAVMNDVGPTSRWGTLSRMRKKMSILTSTKVTEIEEFAVAVVDQEGNKNRLKADMVVLATGMKENEILQDEEYQIAGVTYHKIGSCKEPGLIVQAISDGFKVGCAI